MVLCVDGLDFDLAWRTGRVDDPSPHPQPERAARGRLRQRCERCAGRAACRGKAAASFEPTRSDVRQPER